MMEDPDCSVSISNLICNENEIGFDADDGGEDDNRMIILLNDVETEEYMEKLVFRESSFEGQSHDFFLSCSDSYSSVVGEDWFKCARSTSIHWILKMRDYFGFSSKTAYLAVAYFDRFFMRRTIDKAKLWAIRLLSVACLSLAVKMEEYRVPALSEYQIDGYEFNSKAIQRMELLVLSTLEWRMSLVTPFDYLSYFTYKFQYEYGAKNLLHDAIGFIFAIIEAFSVVDYRPSVIAAAAILAASSEIFTKELLESKMSAISLCGSLEKEHIYACYSAITAESHKKLKLTKRGASSDLSANHSSIDDAIDLADSASFTGLSYKRRRLQLPNIQ